MAGWEQPKNAGLGFRLPRIGGGAWRMAGLGLVVVAALGSVTEIWGTPHVRMQYQYLGRSEAPTYTACTYYGVFGRQETLPGFHFDGCPVIAWLPMKKGWIERGGEAAEIAGRWLGNLLIAWGYDIGGGRVYRDLFTGKFPD